MKRLKVLFGIVLVLVLAVLGVVPGHPNSSLLVKGRVLVNLGPEAGGSPVGFGAALTRDAEVPAPAALAQGATPGSGTGVFVLNGTETEINFSLTVTGLTGPVTAVHFHKGKVSEAGAVVHAVCGDQGADPCPASNGGSISGTWKNTGTQALTTDLLKAFKAGELYINVHTDKNKGGEVRGQIGASSFYAPVEREQETPSPTALAKNQAPGFGTAFFVLNATETELTFNLTYATLTGPATAIHFHKGKIGEAGSVVRLVCGSGGSACPSGSSGSVSGVWKKTDAPALTADLLSALKAGQLYINVHTDANKNGEIRGQLVKST
ncbi:CHRD domain-containing protein [Candidatus Acetothermia bacterium]|nr:CHRD domain-containing protein [Candidatus Acetothermia bacterium]